MTPIWPPAPLGQAHSRNTEDLSHHTHRQLGLLITITQLPPPPPTPSCFIYSTYYMLISRYINNIIHAAECCRKRSHNKTLYTPNIYVKQSWIGSTFCYIEVQHQHNDFKADDSHHGANSVPSMPTAWRNRGVAQLSALSYYKPLYSNNKQRGSSKCGPSWTCTNCWERQSRSFHLTSRHVCNLTVVYLNDMFKKNRNISVSSWNNNVNVRQQLQSPLYIAGTDPSIFLPEVFTFFMEELIRSCVERGLVYSHILVPLN